MKILMIGEKDVGKAGIINRQINGKEYNASLWGRTSQGTIKVDGEDVLFEMKYGRIEGRNSFKESEIQEADGFLLVYSITSSESFRKMNSMREEIYRIKGVEQTEHLPIVVCGNKCDMESEREVAKSEAQRIINEAGCCLFEISAKEGINVRISFVQLIRQIWKYKGYVPVEIRRRMEEEQKKGGK